MKERITTKKIALAGLLLALAVIGANIKIMGSIALDSAPAFIGAILLGPWIGSLLGGIAHMISALLVGFPLSIPVHCTVACIMIASCAIYSLIGNYFKNRYRFLGIFLASVGAYFINVVIGLAIMDGVFHVSLWILFVPLSIAAVTNLCIAAIALCVILSKKLYK